MTSGGNRERRVIESDGGFTGVCKMQEREEIDGVKVGDRWRELSELKG